MFETPFQWGTFAGNRLCEGIFDIGALTVQTPPVRLQLPLRLEAMGEVLRRRLLGEFIGTYPNSDGRL